MGYPVSYCFSNTSLKPDIITLVILQCRAHSALRALWAAKELTLA